MRRWLTAAGAALLAGCASASPPPGGPEDHAPPKLVRITPDTNALNVTDRVVSFWFDETINDRGSGATELSNYFIVSPTDGNVDISWHRSRIDVRPHRGFRPNTAYTVTLLPGLSDLRANIMKSGGAVTFSTGGSIPALRIAGVAFDWAAERPAARALIQAVTPDSIVYLAQSDSAGRFSVGPLPPGSYLVRAVIDANANRALDRNEAYDSVRVTPPLAAPLELLAIVRDTLPPRITTVSVVDSVSVRVSFDRPLDPAAVPGPAAFRLAGADSIPIPITSVLTAKQEADTARLRAEARADSARRADSLLHRPTVAAAPPAIAAPNTAAARGAAASNVAVKPSVPAPPMNLLLHLAHAMRPATAYRLQVTSARALSGRSSTSDRTFSTPAAPKPKAPADTVRRPVVSPRPSTATPPPPSRPLTR